jgi:hypothetical protein
MRGLTPAQYLPLALNTYRVLMTRGTRGCRLYSTDDETQRYLETLDIVRSGNPPAGHRGSHNA